MKFLKLCRGDSEDSEDSNSETRTPMIQRFSYGVGNSVIEVNRQILLSFRLVFFLKVLGLSPANAGWLVLFAFSSLVVTSPLSAFLVDRVKIPVLSMKLGRKKSWHLIGSILGAVTIPLFFTPCFFCQGGQLETILYIAVLNFFIALSYTIVDVSHLSLLPSIAKNQKEAFGLNALRLVAICLLL